MVEDITTLVTALGFPSYEIFLAVMILAIIVIGAIVVITIIRPVLGFFPYTYPNARVRARTGRLFNEKEFSEIVESQNVEEVKNYLRGVPDYAKYIDTYPLEKALDSQLAETYDLIARITPDDSKDSFKFLLKKWDIKNIKSIIIAKEAGLSQEQTVDLLVPFGELSNKLDSLIDTDSVEEVLNALEGTEYPKIVEDALPIYKETGLLLPLEASMDKYLLENLLKTSATPEDENTTLLHNYIGTMVDVANIKIILRAKADNIKYEDIEPYMVSDGYEIREWKLKELMEAEDVSGVISGLEGTDYAPMLSDAMSEFNETGSMATFEKLLDSYVVKTAKTISLKNQFGIGPMIGFLSRKETEVKNLKIIARGKREAGFSPSMIKEMLV
ncbi:V-type ATP synthase subunit C [Methanobacterium lacus]|uniref:A-type ATP synthase subunit C n=1 Tax=Methanobacterium lacus (strain AL-21) TaxID=877455 RepID=F0T965_METLA|nr:V-type ATP synthase subunit C [Methanobacterium lacus]ADZ08687.1 V-type ATP synthase subunit C [Methanobacterium lacus]